ncbi:MAG: type IV pilus modification PilV family protein [Opitutales bacterium]
MKLLQINSMTFLNYNRSRTGFSLIEVILAIGVFLISVLALIGLLAPMLQSVDEVEKVDEITSVVNTVNAFLQSSTEIGDPDASPPVSKFDAIYNAVGSGGEATLFVYRYYDSNDLVQLEVGFSSSEAVGSDAIVQNLFADAAGPIFRVVLSASSVTPVALRSPTRDGDTGIYTLTQALNSYPEGYFAMEARIFAEDPPGPSGTFNTTTNLSELNLREADFTFNTAIVR